MMNLISVMELKEKNSAVSVPSAYHIYLHMNFCVGKYAHRFFL